MCFEIGDFNLFKDEIKNVDIRFDVGASLDYFSKLLNY